ncbi:MAG TPA: prephenate dehydrogenase/arogenate dehydrogenase family protein [Ktedonobacterales bacterium]|jgi:prephenate dehydrogenase
MQTVGIIGLGLIGGSIGLALKQQRENAGALSPTVIAYDNDPGRRQQARQLQAIDQIFDQLAEVAQQADLLIIATPVLAVRQALAEIAPYVRAETVITDTASTKAAVLRWAEELLPGGARFIGGHPMAGGVGSLEQARPDLFHGAAYCIVPPTQADEARHVDASALAAIQDLIATLGARPLLIDAQTHDRCVAAISHLPFITSAALVETAANSPEVEIMRQLISSGFRDTSRLAAGDPAMYQSIAVTNREAMLFWMDAYMAQLQTFRQALQVAETAEAERLLTLFNQARQHRKTLLE